MPGLDPTDPPADFIDLMLGREFPDADQVPLTGVTAIDLAVAGVAWAIQVCRDELAADQPDTDAAAVAAEQANTALRALNNTIAAVTAG